MCYGADLGELGRRVGDDVHQILSGAKPGDVPIYQATKFQFMISRPPRPSASPSRHHCWPAPTR